MSRSGHIPDFKISGFSIMQNRPIIRDLFPWILLIPQSIAPDKSKNIPDEMLIIFFQNVFLFFLRYLRTLLEVVENGENSIYRVPGLSWISGFRDFR